MHEFEQGFSVREGMWHKLGTVLADYPGREEGMREAGHDFQVIERPAFVGGPGNPLYAASPPRHIPAYKALVKSTDESVVFNIVKESYGVVQPEILWDIADAMMDFENVKYETAGILRQGAVLWVLCKLDEPTQIKGDDSVIFPYGLISTTNDGTGSCKASATSVRVVCMNTYKASADQSRSSGLEYTFRHTKNVMARIDDAKLAIKGIRQSHDEFMELAEELAQIHLTEGQRDLFVSSLIPMPADALISERVVKNIDTARAKVQAIFDTVTIPEAHKLTGYGAWNAGIEYLDYIRPARSADSQFGRSLLTQESRKTKLAKLIREVASETLVTA